MIQVAAPAKINLFLQVTGKRPDGYHELFTLMSPLRLADEVLLKPFNSGIRISCSDPSIPTDDSNLAYRAAEVLNSQVSKRRGIVPLGVDITIEKRIPVGAGLGGGSSDAASVLYGLNKYYGFPFSREELMQMGLEIGADVPFFIFGEPALATGIGEYLVPYPNLVAYFVLLLYPGIHVSTAEVYKNLDLGLTNCEKKLKDIVLKDRPFDAAFHSCNDLESVTLAKYPQVKAAKTAVSGSGAQGVLMSGSGSTIFGLFENARAAQRAMCTLERNNASNWQLILTELVAAADDSRQFR
jgi:4-diphosphocytidyl-2-C-methyl-D-erythritol kinase